MAASATPRRARFKHARQIYIEENPMKHQEFNEKKCAQGLASTSEDALAMSNQVADMMREKCPSNINVNINVFGPMKDDMASSEGASKSKFMGGKQLEDSAITFKKDEEGNLIKVLGDGVESKKGNFDKGSFCGELSMKNEPSLFKKDEHGNLMKVQRDGGLKSHYQSADLEIPLIYR